MHQLYILYFAMLRLRALAHTASKYIYELQKCCLGQVSHSQRLPVVGVDTQPGRMPAKKYAVRFWPLLDMFNIGSRFLGSI